MDTPKSDAEKRKGYFWNKFHIIKAKNKSNCYFETPCKWTSRQNERVNKIQTEDQIYDS